MRIIDKNELELSFSTKMATTLMRVKSYEIKMTQQNIIVQKVVLHSW